MEELERLYNELPYFDKQKFIGRHLADTRQEDIDDKASKPKKIYRYWDLDPNDREKVRMEAIDEVFTELAALAGINDYDYDKAVNDMIPMGYKSLSLSSVNFDDMAYKLYCEHDRGCVYDLGCNISRK